MQDRDKKKRQKCFIYLYLAYSRKVLICQDFLVCTQLIFQVTSLRKSLSMSLHQLPLWGEKTPISPCASAQFQTPEEALISYSVFSTFFFWQCSVILLSPSPFCLCLFRQGVINVLNYFSIRQKVLFNSVCVLPSYTWLVSQKKE